MAAPTDPSQAQGAQITLDSFTIPPFPPSAKNLKALTLTSVIPSATYVSLLTQPYEVPVSLPYALESLTLELFAQGYPAGFLTALANRLPNLKSVVVYQQEFSGRTEEQRKDAVEFFRRLPNLRSLSFLDGFVQRGFFGEVAQWVKWNTSDVPGEARRGLMFLEVNYTGTDRGLLEKIQGEKLVKLIGPGLISLSFNMAIATEDDHGTRIEAFGTEVGEGLVRVLTEEESYPRGLRALNSTLFRLTLTQLRKVLEKHKNVMVVNVTVEVDDLKTFGKEVLKILGGCASLEQAEIVIAPAAAFMEIPPKDIFDELRPSVADLHALSSKCSKLSSLKANVMRDPEFAEFELLQNTGV
ncbi:hypothetical protein B0A48_17007 [Cryoendolithus antarcticus]|uniref:Uncharacterized protein n=1 Tax=Cryoendolithus antarcticus TaxID=1507870 RepID=A0A1V8SC20_9PEZI|nr:hypothetical protein B0A48_17007 [Cryoendolithus antarcticus]